MVQENNLNEKMKKDEYDKSIKNLGLAAIVLGTALTVSSFFVPNYKYDDYYVQNKIKTNRMYSDIIYRRDGKRPSFLRTDEQVYSDIKNYNSNKSYALCILGMIIGFTGIGVIAYKKNEEKIDNFFK